MEEGGGGQTKYTHTHETRACAHHLFEYCFHKDGVNRQWTGKHLFDTKILFFFFTPFKEKALNQMFS